MKNKLLIIFGLVFALTLLSNLMIPSFANHHGEGHHSIPPPLSDMTPKDQLLIGIEPKNIECKYGLELIQKYDGSPACVKHETAEKLIQRGWAEPLGNVIFERSAHPEFSPISESENTLRPDDIFQIRHSAGYTTVYITLSSWDEYYEWERHRGTEHDAMPPVLVNDDNINPIVYDLLSEMWKFEDYEVSRHDDNLLTKTIQKDYSVSNHHGIHDWLESEYEKQFGKSNDGFGNHFEYGDNVYTVTMLAVD